MIVDTSAVLAILFEEDDAEHYARAFTQADSCRMSAASFVEAAIVVDAQTKDQGQPPVRRLRSPRRHRNRTRQRGAGAYRSPSPLAEQLEARPRESADQSMEELPIPKIRTTKNAKFAEVLTGVSAVRLARPVTLQNEFEIVRTRIRVLLLCLGVLGVLAV